MNNLLHSHSPYRIFGLSILITIFAILGSWWGMGLEAAIVVVLLMVIEIVFSFDNAIINAKVLRRLSKFWQMIFLTVGIVIAVFGMRVIFPVLIVVATAGLSFSDAVLLAFQHPHQYAEQLHHARPLISAFGGSFLLTLALYFFMDRKRTTHWWQVFEKNIQTAPEHWAAPALAALTVIAVALSPANRRVVEVLVYGLAGIVVYVILYGSTHFLERHYEKTAHKRLKGSGQVGLAALSSFIYLEVLDASFSFDSVIGAFAITTNIVLIAIGLGIGALWVRSLTIFIIRRGTLEAYKYLEHGAHYTVVALAGIMFLSIFVEIPDWVAGSIGVLLISASIISSSRKH